MLSHKLKTSLQPFVLKQFKISPMSVVCVYIHDRIMFPHPGNLFLMEIPVFCLFLILPWLLCYATIQMKCRYQELISSLFCNSFNVWYLRSMCIIINIFKFVRTHTCTLRLTNIWWVKEHTWKEKKNKWCVEMIQHEFNMLISKRLNCLF